MSEKSLFYDEKRRRRKPAAFFWVKVLSKPKLCPLRSFCLKVKEIQPLRCFLS
jgi:hypothetical protein